MLTVYEFKLNYTKTTQSRHFGHTCTGTPLTCTSTGCILLGCTGTGLDLYQYKLASVGVYRYRYRAVPVQLWEFCP